MIARVFKVSFYSSIFFLALSCNQHAKAAITELGDMKQLTEALKSLEITESSDAKKITKEIADSSSTVFTKGNLFSFLENFIKDFKGLTYQQTQGFSFFIPGSDQLVTYNWNFGGSGNMFLPFPSATAHVSMRNTSNQQVADQSILAALSKAFVKNEIYKKSKKTKLMKLLTKSKLSPLTLFGIKVILLFKDANPFKDAAFIKNELFRLLFRLSLSSDITFLDQQKALSSYLPDAITELLTLIAPEALSYLDHTWNMIRQPKPETDSQSSYLAGNYYHINCFVFNDQKNAASCLDSCKTLGLDGDIKKVILQQGLEFVPTFEQFINLSSSQESSFDPSSFLVGEKTFFGSINDQEIAKVLPTLAQEYAKLSGDTRLLLIQGTDKRWWLVQVLTELSFKETCELITFSFINACKEAFIQQQNYFATHPEEAEQYYQSQMTSQVEQDKISLFLTSPEGKASLERLEKNSAILEQKQFAQDNAKKLKEVEKALAIAYKTIKTLKDNLAKVEYKVRQQKVERDRAQKVVILNGAKACITKTKAEKEAIQNNLKQLEDEASKIFDELSEKEKEFDDLKLQKQQYSTNTANTLAQKQQERDALILVIMQKQARGQSCLQEIDDLNKLQTTITKLESHPESKTPQETTTASKERSRIYQQEIKILSNLLKVKQKQIPAPTEAVAFFNQQEGLRLYIESLKKKATSALTENINSGFLAQFIVANPEFSGFITKLNEPMNEIKEKLRKTLISILHHSTHFKENMVMYHALIKSCAPTLLELFEEITAENVSA